MGQTPRKRSRGENEIITLSVRVLREDWIRLHALAIDEHCTLQEVVLRGLDHVFAQHRQPPLRRTGAAD